MNTQAIITFLLITLCVAGCSQPDGAIDTLVPATAEEVMTSSDYRLEQTTEDGVQFYVREISPTVATSIREDSSESRFLVKSEKPCLLVMVYDNEIIDLKSDASPLTAEQGLRAGVDHLVFALGRAAGDEAVKKRVHELVEEEMRKAGDD